MILELPQDLETALETQAREHGVSTATYLSEILRRELASSIVSRPSGVPRKTGYGMFAKYGPAPSEEEIDENRADMFRNFRENWE